jgi:hypothetical protein
MASLLQEPSATPGRHEVRAITAALAAWDQAFVSPSKWGLPSAAAIAAYRAIVPEQERAIREKIVAALIARAERAGRALH